MKPNPIRTEIFEAGEVQIYAEAIVPMSPKAIEALAGEPYFEVGDSWVLQWWEGYGQADSVDLFVTVGGDASGAEGFELAEGLGSLEEFEALVARVRELQERALSAFEGA
jgi:hypothetical protein